MVSIITYYCKVSYGQWAAAILVKFDCFEVWTQDSLMALTYLYQEIRLIYETIWFETG